VRSAYALAIDSTRDAIVQRARQYKWLVIATSVVGVASLLAVIALGSFMPLTVALAGPAAVSAFLALDLSTVQQWRRAVLSAWLNGDLQFALLARTLRQVPALPPSTLEGMLETLPNWSFHALSPAAQSALAQTQQALDRIALQALVVTSVAWAVAATVTITAVASGRPLWLLAVPASVMPYLAWRQLAQRQVRYQRSRALQAWSAPESDSAADSTLMDALNWHGVPRSLHAAWGALPAR
jgi:hypothetical protein